MCGNFSPLKKISERPAVANYGPSTTTAYVQYSLNFRSLIAPSSNVSLQLLTFTNFRGSSDGSRGRLLVKQSYILFTWIFFLTKQRSGKTAGPSFFIKPLRSSRFTLLKAPMAHKTFSQEQYGYRFYSITASFRLREPRLRGSISLNSLTLDKVLFLMLLSRSNFFFFETNLFFLQKLTITLHVRDAGFLALI
jgi:hypothetical protein